MSKKLKKTASEPISLQASLVKVGKISSPRSLKGEVWILLFAGQGSRLGDQTCDWIAEIDQLVLQKPGSPAVIHHVEFVHSHGDKIVLKLEGVDDRSAAEGLKGWEIWVPQSLFVSARGENIYLREILNFRVEDNGRVLGVITGFESNNVQDILVVRLEGSDKREALIPLVKDFLISIDYEMKTVKMNLPEGLVEANLAV